METTTITQREPPASIEEGIFKSDTEYLEGYFQVCELLQAKRTVLKKFERELNSVVLENKINDLNRQIKEKDGLFWVKVERSLAEGNKFAIEEIGSGYGLNAFEKKILLFLLHMFFKLSKNVCSRYELLKIFDVENSVTWRMRNLVYLTKDSRLLKNDILFRTYKNISKLKAMDLSLTPIALDILSKRLNGEKVELKAEAEDDMSSCKEVGYVKDPEYTMDDVVIKIDVKEKLQLFMESFKGDELTSMGVYQKIKKGKGLIFMFYGPPGTGKTMLAEAIASFLDKKMLIVEYPKITSCWLGETDKNIQKVFKSARDDRLLLLMDEADTLLYSRSYATQGHNIRFVNIILQELERFEGIVVLTTNMDAILDTALERRVSLKIKFELPDENMRAEIWKTHMPTGVEISQDVDFVSLARRYDFAGGYIKNAVLNAMRRIAIKKQKLITMDDLVFGANMEREGLFDRQKRQVILGFAKQ